MVLQNILLPNLVFDAPAEMYVRLNEHVRLHLKDTYLGFRDGGRAWFDTFYNGVTIGAWQGLCTIDDLSLRLHGDGRFLVRVGQHRIGYPHRWLDEREVLLKPGEASVIPLEFWPELTQGMLYFCVEAIGAATLHGGGFETTTPPARDVQLGLVITHFRRKQFLIPALKRLRQALRAQDFATACDIELIVVDNSQDVTVAEAEGATLIPNRNLGGSGGFMRGLLYLKDNGFSHCLFMDDDASCEIESILRCYRFMQYTGSDRRAVAGCLLREMEPHRLFEKGARFDGMCRPLKQGYDMRHVDALLGAEHTDQKPDYGGWWFFGFSISAVKYFAFPFFVRGDDIQFSTRNKFDIFTMNGIGCWGEDFSLKSGPMTEYLDTRYHILQSLCILRASRTAILKLLCQFFFFAAYSYKYATARAITLAMEDVMKGPPFWLRDMDMQGKRAEIQGFAASEKMVTVDRSEFSDMHYMPEWEPRFRRLIRRMTLNGFLIPSFMLRDGVLFQHKGFKGILRNIFRFRQVLYEHEPTQTGFVSRHDKRQFFTALLAFGRALARLGWRCEALRREYGEQLPNMTCEAFWRGIYAAELAEQLVPAPVAVSLTAANEEDALVARP